MSSVALRGVMLDADYRAERERIRALYGDTTTSRTAAFDQALARLFYRSGWTQEQLAAVEAKSQKWVDYRVRFGRFLSFSTPVLNANNLTEGRFRSYWERTDKTETNERIRFQAVQKLMEAELSLQKNRSPSLRRPVAQAILEKFADGGWHHLETIVKETGAAEPDVVAVLTQMLTRGTYDTACERRMSKGGSSWSYRLVRGRGRKVDVEIVLQELSPIVRALEVEGRKHVARWSPGTIARLAHELKIALERVTHTALPIASAEKDTAS